MKKLNFKLDPFKISLMISILIHGFIILFSGFTAVEGEINPEDYKIVQLMDLQTAIDQNKIQDNEGELQVTANKNMITTEFPKDEQLSLYLPFFKVARLPEFIIKVKPVYPVLAKTREVESEVITEVYIDSKGVVRKVIILKSGGEEFDQSVMEALDKCKFRPAISKEGQSVPVRVRIPFKFELE